LNTGLEEQPQDLQRDVELIVTLDVGLVISYRLGTARTCSRNTTTRLEKPASRMMIRGAPALGFARDPKRLFRRQRPSPSTRRPNAVRFCAAESPYGLQKEMEIRLAPNGEPSPRSSTGDERGAGSPPISPLGLSGHGPRGGADPAAAKGKHLLGRNAKSPSDFGPTRCSALAVHRPQGSATDLGSEFITLTQDVKAKGPTKLGLLHKMHAVGYHNGETLFVKYSQRFRTRSIPTTA